MAPARPLFGIALSQSVRLSVEINNIPRDKNKTRGDAEVAADSLSVHNINDESTGKVGGVEGSNDNMARLYRRLYSGGIERSLGVGRRCTAIRMRMSIPKTFKVSIYIVEAAIRASLGFVKTRFLHFLTTQPTSCLLSLDSLVS